MRTVHLSCVAVVALLATVLLFVKVVHCVAYVQHVYVYNISRYYPSLPVNISLDLHTLVQNGIVSPDLSNVVFKIGNVYARGFLWQAAKVSKLFIFEPSIDRDYNMICTVFVLVNDTLYGACYNSTSSLSPYDAKLIFWKYDVHDRKLSIINVTNVLHTEYEYIVPISAIYDPTRHAIYTVGTARGVNVLNAPPWNANLYTVIIINVTTDKVKIVINRQFIDHVSEKFVSVADLGNYLAVGDNHGRIWLIPKATIDNVSTWKILVDTGLTKLWITDIVHIGDRLYFLVESPYFNESKTDVALYVYYIENGTLRQVMNVTPLLPTWYYASYMGTLIRYIHLASLASDGYSIYVLYIGSNFHVHVIEVHDTKVVKTTDTDIVLSPINIGPGGGSSVTSSTGYVIGMNLTATIMNIGGHTVLIVGIGMTSINLHDTADVYHGGEFGKIWIYIPSTNITVPLTKYWAFYTLYYSVDSYVINKQGLILYIVSTLKIADEVGVNVLYSIALYRTCWLLSIENVYPEHLYKVEVIYNKNVYASNVLFKPVLYDNFEEYTLGKLVNYPWENPIGVDVVNFTFNGDAYVGAGLLFLAKAYGDYSLLSGLAFNQTLPKTGNYIIRIRLHVLDWGIVTYSGVVIGDKYHNIEVMFYPYTRAMYIYTYNGSSYSTVFEREMYFNIYEGWQQWITVLIWVRNGHDTLVKIVFDNGTSTGWIDTHVDITTFASSIRVGFLLATPYNFYGPAGLIVDYVLVLPVTEGVQVRVEPVERLGIKVALPVKYVHYSFSIVYAPHSVKVRHVVTSINMTAVKYGSLGNYGWFLEAEPYVNETPFTVPTSNYTLVGSWVSGTLSNLAKMDYVYYWLKTYNKSNTMILAATFNVSGFGWIVHSKTPIVIKDIVVKLAGYCSKYVNTRASLEILDWSTGKWVTIDNVALNQTTDTEKTYDFATLLGGDLSRFISPSGVIAFKINVTDVQTYPSTYVDVSLDELVVKVVYVNETEADMVSEVTIVLPPNSTVTISNVTIIGKYVGTLTYRKVSVQVLSSNGTVLTSIENASLGTELSTTTFSIGKTVSRNVTLRISMHILTGLTGSGGIEISGIRLGVSGKGELSVIEATCNVPHISVPKLHFENIVCRIVVPLVYGLDRLLVNKSLIALDIPKFMKLLDAYFGTVRPMTRFVFGKVYLLDISGSDFATLDLYEKPTVKLDRFGVLHVSYMMPIGTFSKVNITVPTPFVFVVFSNGTLEVINRTNFVLVIHHVSELEGFELYYGVWFSPRFYMWINLSNPTVKLLGVEYSNVSRRLTVSVDAEGTVEVNVKTFNVPYSVYIVYGGKTWTAHRVHDYVSYRACTPPCWYYDPASRIVRVKAVAHSPIMFVLSWSTPQPVVKVLNVSLAMPSSAVVNEPVTAHVVANVQSNVETDINMTVKVTCIGPTTVTKVRKFTWYLEPGISRVSMYMNVTFSVAGQYTCYAEVNGIKSNYVTITVKAQAAPPLPRPRTYMPYILLILLFAIAVTIVLVFVRHVHKRHEVETIII